MLSAQADGASPSFRTQYKAVVDAHRRKLFRRTRPADALAAFTALLSDRRSARDRLYTAFTALGMARYEEAQAMGDGVLPASAYVTAGHNLWSLCSESAALDVDMQQFLVEGCACYLKAAHAYESAGEVTLSAMVYWELACLLRGLGLGDQAAKHFVTGARLRLQVSALDALNYWERAVWCWAEAQCLPQCADALAEMVILCQRCVHQPTSFPGFAHTAAAATCPAPRAATATAAAAEGAFDTHDPRAAHTSLPFSSPGDATYASHQALLQYHVALLLTHAALGRLREAEDTLRFLQVRQRTQQSAYASVFVVLEDVLDLCAERQPCEQMVHQLRHELLPYLAFPFQRLLLEQLCVKLVGSADNVAGVDGEGEEGEEHVRGDDHGNGKDVLVVDELDVEGVPVDVIGDHGDAKKDDIVDDVDVDDAADDNDDDDAAAAADDDDADDDDVPVDVNNDT